MENRNTINTTKNNNKALSYDDVVEKLEEINTLFHIKTDEHVDKIHIPTGKNRNYYRRGEET